MCRVLCVSRSGYYAWRSRPESKRAKEDRQLLAEIKEVFEDSHRTYGSPRMQEELKKKGISAGRHRIARLMSTNGISGEKKKKFKVTTDSEHTKPVAENILNRNFVAKQPNEKWVTDITYIWTSQGWLYLAVILDLFSRMVIGWSIRERMTADLVCDALRMAIATRSPLTGVLSHSDRGSQYASTAYLKLLETFGISSSMSRKGNCWDNAVAESFFATLKKDLIYRFDFDTREQAKIEIFKYIEVFYNRRRIHSTLGYLSPFEFEEQHKIIQLIK